MEKLVTGAGEAIAKFASGDLFAAITTGITALIGALGDLGNGAAEVDKKMGEATKGLKLFSSEGLENILRNQGHTTGYPFDVSLIP